MKKILLFASAALLFAGCAKENIIPTVENGNNSQKGELTLSFSASQAGFGTKAAIGETTIDAEGAKSTAINWQESDKISVFDGAGANCEFSTKDFNAEAPTFCTFEGDVTELATDYTAVYPYTADATISKTGVISGVTLPATQTAVAGSFDPNAALMAAKTVEGGRALAFQNLVGYVKVATDFECKKIELCAASEEALAGASTISFNEGTPSFALGEGAVSTITLLPEGEGTIAAGKTYYIAVPATTLAAGWKISFTATNGNVYSRQGTKPIQFKTNTVINLGTIELDDLIPYVTFTAEKSQTCKMNFQPISSSDAFSLGEGEYFEYSVGGGEWKRFTSTVNNITFGGSNGNLRMRGKSSKGTAKDQNSNLRIQFTTENSPVDCSGDIRTLIDYENYADANTADALFKSLFYENTQLRTAPSLPAETLAAGCYQEMFHGCTALTQAPELPATNLANNCYFLMFGGCSALTQAPELPATTLAAGCYQQMFSGCSALTQAPKLSATTLAESCYYLMFGDCSALTQAPELPATTLAESCYDNMFNGCSALTQAPTLPATKLAAYCYQEMFRGCSALSNVTMLATNIKASGCLSYWLFEAGTYVSNPQLTLYNQTVYDTMIKYNDDDDYLPGNWMSNVQYKK